MSSVKKNFVYNILYQLLVILLPLITAPYISRTLGAKAVGIYSYINSIAYYFLLFAMLGISNHGNRSIASTRDNKEKMNKCFWEIYSIQFITYIVAIISYILYIILFVSENKLIFFIQLIYVVSGLFDISWLFFGLEKFKITVLRNTIIKIFTLICIFIFVKTPDDLWKYTLIFSLGTFLSQFYLWFNIKDYIHFEKVKLNNVKKHIKSILVLFIPVIAYSIYKVMDKIMIGAMSSYEQVGFYQNSEKIISIPMGVITALGTVMLPRMSNIIAKGENDVAKRYIGISIKLVTIVGSAIAFGIIGASEVFAPVYFGEEFTACSTVMALLAVTVFAMSWANVVRTQYLIPQHNDKVYISSTIVGALINLLVNLLLIPKYGANGAAVGTIFAEFTVMLVQVIYTSKKIPIIKNIISSVPYLIFGLIMMIIVYYEGILLNKNVITLAIQILTGGIVYCILSLTYMFIRKDEFYFLFERIINKFIRKKSR